VDQFRRGDAVPKRGRRASTRVGDLADRDPSVVHEDVTVEELLANPAFKGNRRAVVRGEDGEVGILSATAIQRAVQARRLLDEHEPAVPNKPSRVS
jgi:predicted transcriptional regulator